MLNKCLLIFFVFILSGCSQTAPFDNSPAIGITRLELVDTDRENWEKTAPRPLMTSLWYPAIEGAEMTEIGIPYKRPVFIGGHAARNADFLESTQRHPLIILSHGTGGAGMQMMWLGRALAAEGYIVAAVDHHGNTAAEATFDPRGFRMPWERTKDISAVIDLLLSDPNWGPRIDREKIGAIGFSLGGYSVTAAAGGRLDFDQFKTFCESELKDGTCEAQSEYPEAEAKFDAMLKLDADLRDHFEEHRHDYKDERIKAVVALAPAIVQAITEESLSNINMPFLTIVGENDQVAPAVTNANRLIDYIPSSQIKYIEDGEHYTFLNRCNKRGRKYVPVCRDAGKTPRAQSHDETIKLVTDFLGRSLGISK